MIRGYVSSDEDDYDDYDFGYSEPFVREKKESTFLPEIKNQLLKEKLHSALEEKQKVEIFFKAIDHNDFQTMEKLLSLGLSVDCTDPQEWTPLLKACGQGNVEVVQFLLEHGADPNKRKELLSPLMTCCTHTLVPEESKLGCVRFLLQHGAEINAKDKFRTTALMYAIISGYVDIVTELLESPGIDVNIQDKEGWTAIFHAVDHNNLKLVEKLISAETDLKLKDKHGRTAITLALYKDLKDVAAALGYIEEKPVIVKQKKTLKEIFLKELPDSKGQGGFYAEAESILHTFDQFNVKNISLPDFLNATDKDLYEIGVKLRPDRQRILLKAIHRYHLQPWKKGSLHQIKHGTQPSMEDVVAIIGSLARDLTIANASIKYVKTRIFSRRKRLKTAAKKEIIQYLTNVFASAELLKATLMDILESVNQIKPEFSADFIHPVKKENSKKKFTKFVSYALGVATAGYFICCKSAVHFRTLVSLLMHPVAVCFQFSQFYQSYEYFDEYLVIALNE